MTIQQHASFDSSAAELNATSKLVKAWESKNAKNAAKAGGVSLMALSLAACGGSSTTTTTPVVETPAVTTPSAVALSSSTSDVYSGSVSDPDNQGITITANQLTLDATDIINAGSGTDTLAITNTAANGGILPAELNGVENIQMTSYGASSIDLLVATGVEKVVSKGSTAADTFTNVQTLAAIEANGSSSDLTVKYANSLMSGTDDTVTLTLSTGADLADVVIQGATAANVVETINIVSSGATANAVNSILSNSAAIGTLDISGSADLTLGTGTAFGSGDVLAVNIDAADFTGDLTLYADGADTNASITGGSGDDTIYLDGVDTFYAADNGNATNNVVTSIVGGDGADTLVIDGSLVASQLVTSTADTADNVLSGVETVSHVSSGASGSTGTADVTLDASISADVTAVSMSLTNSTSSGSTGNVYVGEITNVKGQAVSVTGTKGSHATAEVEQEITLYDGSAAATTASITAAGDFTILTFNDASDDSATTATDESGAVESVSITSGASDLVVDSLVAADAYSVTLAGAKDVTVTAANLGATDTSNTATTDDLVTVSAAGLSGDLDYTKSEAGVYSITGGSGTNDIRLGSLGADTTVVGGAGTDTVYLLDDTSASAVAVTTDAAVETLVIDTTSSGADTFNMLNVNAATEVKIVDAANGGAFAVALSNVNAQVVNLVTAEAASGGATTNNTNDTDFGSAVVVTVGKATGATNSTVKLSGDAQATATTSSFDGVIESTGKVTIDSQIQTSAGVYLDTNVELKGAITELVLTGGGAQSSTAVANIDIAEVGSDVALTSIDATAFTGDISATDVSALASTATISLGAGDTTLTLAVDQLVRDAITVTDTGGADTLAVTLADVGADTEYRPGITGVETVSITGSNSTSADETVTFNLADATGVTALVVDANGSDDKLSVTNATGVGTLTLAGTSTSSDGGIQLAGISGALAVVSSAAINTTANTFTADDVTSLTLSQGTASDAIKFSTLSADAATAITLGGSVADASGAVSVVTLEADELTALTIDAANGTVLVDNITADKLATITISGDNAVTLGEDGSGTDGTVATVALASVAGGTATAAINLSGTMEYAANASIVTGTASDNVDLSSAVAAGVTVATGAGDDTISIDSAALRAVDGGADADDGDATTYDGGNDTLVITGTNNTGTGVVNLASTADQLTSYNGFADSVVQQGFESVDLSGLTSSGSYGFNITAATTGSTIVASAENDVIAGGAAADTISGGAGADTINLGTDSTADTLKFVNDDGTASAFDTVTNFAISTDVLDFATASTTHAADESAMSVAAAVTGSGTVTAAASDGIVTFGGADVADIDTLAEALGAVELVVEEVEAGSDDSYVVGFEFAGNTYVAEYSVDDSSDAATLENLVMLSGITGITDIDTSAAANTIVIA